MVYVCCVGFASLDVVCDKLYVPGILVCGSFLISECMYDYGCMYFLAELVLMCADVMVMSSV